MDTSRRNLADSERRPVPTFPASHSDSPRSVRFASGGRRRIYVAVAMLAAGAVVAGLLLRGADPGAVRRPSDSGERFGRFADELVVVREIELAESQAVMNVTPRVKLDPRVGSWWPTPARHRSGGIPPTAPVLSDFGRKGRGPGEFLRLSAALRADRNAIVAVEINGRISRFDSAGHLAGSTRQTPLGPVYNATLADDSLLVLAGRLGGRGDTPLLHVWSLRRDTLLRSFFRPPAPPNGMEGTYAFAGTADVTARGDTLAAVFALTDTVYLFDSRGRTLEKIAIPFRGFRRPSERMPVRASIDEYRLWASHFSAISQVFWQSDGSFLVQYFDTNGVEPEPAPAANDTARRAALRSEGQPAAARGGGFRPGNVLPAPRGGTPSSWVVARLAR